MFTAKKVLHLFITFLFLMNLSCIAIDAQKLAEAEKKFRLLEEKRRVASALVAKLESASKDSPRFLALAETLRKVFAYLAPEEEELAMLKSEIEKLKIDRELAEVLDEF